MTNPNVVTDIKHFVESENVARGEKRCDLRNAELWGRYGLGVLNHPDVNFECGATIVNADMADTRRRRRACPILGR
jgi:hypothetical protein